MNSFRACLVSLLIMPGCLFSVGSRQRSDWSLSRFSLKATSETNVGRASNNHGDGYTPHKRKRPNCRSQPRASGPKALAGNRLRERLPCETGETGEKKSRGKTTVGSSPYHRSRLPITPLKTREPFLSLLVGVCWLVQEDKGT
ncbi:hypothetical protein B0T22DRAFT_461978 [Podospora appendiculata]|uniref:Secreted protein n=1 Tax=Podospora appendiculata TaxID=314037 RepID=A0AAE0XCE0_9PEZI|nr:hypothetical protein B0T22DRAFT_461978 [Podospora appendiculata]